MKLTDKQIEDFQLLWKNRFGYDISRKEAFEQGIKLVRLMELIYQPMTVSDFEIIQRRRASRNSKSQRLDDVDNFSVASNHLDTVSDDNTFNGVKPPQI